MKIAVIVVGSHFSGKSRTINKDLKPLLGISERQHIFHRKGKDGYVLSQSFGEAGSDPKGKIYRVSHYDLLVLADRPATEPVSCLIEIEKILDKYKFKHHRVFINASSSDSYYKSKAKEILRHLDK